MKKKFFVILTVIAMCFAFTACGDSGTSKEDKPEIDPDAKVTLEKYEELREAKWSDMSMEEMEQFLGVKAVVDEDRTKEWGDGYIVADFPGPDSGSGLHVLYKKVDGKWGTASMSPTGALIE